MARRISSDTFRPELAASLLRPSIWPFGRYTLIRFMHTLYACSSLLSSEIVNP